MKWEKIIKNVRKRVHGKIENFLIHSEDFQKFGPEPDEISDAIHITNNVGPGFFIIEEHTKYDSGVYDFKIIVHYLCFHGNDYNPYFDYPGKKQNCQEPECIVREVMLS